jgi:hypothetical protein
MKHHIQEKLKKILALTQNPATSLEEAKTAMAKATALATENNILLADIIAADNNTDALNIEKQSVEGYPFGRWTSEVLQVFMHCFGIEFTYAHLEKRVSIYGEKTDVQITKTLFAWLNALFRDEYKKIKHNLPQGAAHENSFYRGLCVGIVVANKKKSAEITHGMSHVRSESYALVPVAKKEKIDEFIKKENPRLRPAPNRKKHAQDDTRALSAGFTKGKTIKLIPQIESIAQ